MLTHRYCEYRLAKTQVESRGCAGYRPAPEAQKRPLFRIEILGLFRALPAPFFCLFLALPAFATSPPAAFHGFCSSHPGQCARVGGTAPVAMTKERWAQLKTVNRAVNRSIRIRPEAIDRWSVLPDGGKGDCEDYALTKRMKLLALGWPSGALLVTVVRLRDGQGHAVLTVRTNEGLFVLDSLRGSIRSPDKTGYRYFTRQSPGNPIVWEVVR